MKVTLVKLRESDNPLHPGNIPSGTVKQGDFVAFPKVGECFDVGSWWSTSTVQEILSQDTFRTHNSIYQFTITV